MKMCICASIHEVSSNSRTMPSVPATKEPTVTSSACPHSAKLHGHTNGDGKILEGSLPLNGVDKLDNGKESGRGVQRATKATSPDRKWIRPDLPSRCKWSLGASKADSPHAEIPRSKELCRNQKNRLTALWEHLSYTFCFVCLFHPVGKSSRQSCQIFCTVSGRRPWSASTRSPKPSDSSVRYVSVMRKKP